MSAVIRVEGLRKKYSRNANAHRGYTMQDLLREILGRQPASSVRTDEFWAVDDVSFECAAGESLALIGRNGAGKTTVLKMMTGLTKLDGGRIELNGRVQALINLGAGFSPALSGRDNIFNSAAIMGMSRRETAAIADAIVDFAELEEFIDSPVGTYSSGMRARLGFSVAVHLRPDILLLDEILSVGDHAFQNKCFIKMQELKGSGVTIVLVSHNHTSVLQMCNRALWLHRGRTMKLGPAKETVQAYLDFMESIEQQEVQDANRQREARRAAAPAPTPTPTPVDLPKMERVSPAAMEGLGALAQSDNGTNAATPATPPAVRGAAQLEAEEYLYHKLHSALDYVDDVRLAIRVDGAETERIPHHAAVEIEYSFRLKRAVEALNVSLVFYRKDGTQLATISTLNGDRLTHVRGGEVRCRVHIRDFYLNPGKYVLVMPIHEGKSYLYRDIVKEFTVKAGPKLAWNLSDFDYDLDVLTP